VHPTRDLIAAGDVLLLPKQTFRTLRGREPFLAVWLAVSLVSAALRLAQVEVVRRAIAFLVERGASPEVAPAAEAVLDGWTLCGVWLAPLGIALGWCAEAAFVQLASGVRRGRRPAAGRVGFRSLLCVIAYASVPQVVERGIDLWVTWRDGPAFTPELLPLLPASTAPPAWIAGDPADPVSRAVLAALTPFAVWGLILRIIGIRELCRTSRRTALAWAAPAWFALRALTSLATAILANPVSPSDTPAYSETPGISSS
jgi:hypothetical protein